MALEGRITDHHRFLLQTLLDHVRFLDGQVARLDQRIERALCPFADALERLRTISGVQKRTAEHLLAEIGTDMAQFPSAGHLVSWAGMCPGNNESAGKSRRAKPRKGDVWLRRALGLAASGAVRKKGCFLGAKYRRIASRRGKARAMVAVGHTILQIVHYLLATRQPYAELGADFYDKVDTDRKVRYHLKRLAQLGVTVETEAA